MTTPKQVAANRRNARMSTGPKTASGKAQSRRNALMHGLTARVLLDDEDPEGFEALRQSLWELKKPVGPLEEQIRGNVAQMLWRKFRIPGFERDLIQWMETQGEDFATQQAILLRGVAAMDDEEGDDER